MSDPYVSITLDFATQAPGVAVLQEIIAAFSAHSTPFELVSARINRFDLDEVDDEEATDER